MSIKTQAAVLREAGKRFEIEELQIAEPGPNQLLLRLGASGICHSDESIRSGAFPHPTPIVLGHEGAGIVEQVGTAITDIVPGDCVVCVPVPSCGVCYTCLRGQTEICERRMEFFVDIGFIDRAGEKVVPFFGLGTFANHITVNRQSVVPIKTELPFAQLALFGCAIQTGVGAVLNAADLKPGATVAVVGCGGVGQSIIQGARIAGAAKIIAVDPNASKRDAAMTMGATDTVDPGHHDPIEQVRVLTNGRGVDCALEAVGLAETILGAFRMARIGGRVVVTGAGGKEDICLSPNELIHSARTIVTSQYGSGPPARDIPAFVSMAENGQLKLKEMVSKTYSLDQINDAFDALNNNEVIRAVIVYE